MSSVMGREQGAGGPCGPLDPRTLIPNSFITPFAIIIICLSDLLGGVTIHG